MALHGNISAPVWVTDLVEVSKDATSLVVCTWKKFFGWGLWVSFEWCHKLRTSWPTLPSFGCQSLDGSISLKFLLETRLLSESFDTLDDLLRFRQKKIFFGWGLQIFCEWHHKWSSFGAILAHVTWPRVQPLGRSVSLKFLLETRLESKFFEPLINFLAFLDQKLWSKVNKLIN